MKTLQNLTAVPEDKRRPLTETECAIFVACQMMKPQPVPVPAAELKEAVRALDIFLPKFFDAYPPSASFFNHVHLSSASYDPCMAALAIAMSDRPGVAALWAWTVYQRGLELGRPYTIADFTDDFPMGPPTSDGQLPVWDAQKGDGPSAFFPCKTDNILDIAETWQPQKEKAVA